MRYARTLLTLASVALIAAASPSSEPPQYEVVAVEVVASTQEVVAVYTAGLVQGAGSSACYATPIYDTAGGKTILIALRCDATKKCDGPCSVSKGPVQPNGTQLVWCSCGGTP